MQNTITWWEKTVEYAFIQKHIAIDTMIAPLDGHHERAGDAIFSADGLWIVIEFKRDENGILDERCKYKDYYRARDELSSRDGHHLLVYGYESTGNLDLACKTYFSGHKISISEFTNHGILLEEFKEYLDILLKHKKTEGSGGTGGFDSVVVVAKDESGVHCMSYKEFGISIGMKKEIDPPSLGMGM